MSDRLWCVIAVVIGFGCDGLAARGQPAAPEPVILTGGFADHMEPASGGRVDWSNGYLLAEGIGFAQGVNKQQELLARQAARQVAVRNVLALAKGIRIDAAGTVGGVRDGVVRVQGVVRGHEEVTAEWHPHRTPPQAHVVVRVPLWGVNSLASAFVRTHRVRLRDEMVVRRPLVIDGVDVADYVLVIDARGVDLAPGLFPVVKDTDGAVLYDIRTLPREWAGRVPLARFVESDLAFEDLRAAVESGAPLRYALVGYQPSASRSPGDTTTAPAAKPTTQPAEKRSKRRAKRRMAVRAAQAGGRLEKTEVVLTREDVDRIRRSPEGASALREAHVIIVVDAAAAGTEGRLRSAPGAAYALTP